MTTEEKFGKQLELFTNREIDRRKKRIDQLQKEIEFYDQKLNELLNKEYKPINN